MEREAPAGEGGLAAVSEWGVSVFSGDGAELRWRGERALHSSKQLEAAAVAELQVALALRGCGKNGKLDTHINSHTTQNTSNSTIFLKVVTRTLDIWMIITVLFFSEGI